MIHREGLDPNCEQCARYWLHIVNQPKTEPEKRASGPLLGGWLLAITVPLVMAVFS